MKEIKFRAWHKDNKSFIYYTFFDIWCNGWHIAENHHFVTAKMNIPTTSEGIYAQEDYVRKQFSTTFINDCRMQQFTGLKDKDGKEIYEGDLIGEEGLFYEVKFQDGYFAIGCSPMIDWIYRRARQGLKTEIIGNIYENPELLK